MEEIQFTRLPTKLIYALDSDLLKMLAILIQQESYWIEHKKIGKDGSFYKPIKEFIVLPNFRPAERGFKSKISRQCEPDSSLG